MPHQFPTFHLIGSDAVIFHVAKNGLVKLADTRLRQLQIGIAVGAGLREADWVRPGELLRMVASLADRLTQNQVLVRPIEGLVEATHLASLGTKGDLTPLELMLNGILSQMTICRVVDDNQHRIIEWQSGLPADFDAQAAKLVQIEPELSTTLET